MTTLPSRSFSDDHKCIEILYTGKYEVKDGAVQGEVSVKFYGRKTSPIFGSLTKFWVRFSGKVRKVMDLQNYVVEDPKKEILVRLTKRAQLS